MLPDRFGKTGTAFFDLSPALPRLGVCGDAKSEEKTEKAESPADPSDTRLLICSFHSKLRMKGKCR